MKRCFSVEFSYNEDTTLPDEMKFVPHPDTATECELLLTTTTCIQTLAMKYGLEQALTMVQEAASGKLDGFRFDTEWHELSDNDDDFFDLE